jgi:Lrp/AsnC family transcriptional regulator for asnA, asnC and gidA
MSSGLDSVDQAITRLLMEDGRMPVAEIARRINHATERATHYRLERLMRLGVMRLGVIVDPRAVGFPVSAEVLVKVEPGCIQTVAEKLAKLELVSYVACTLGNHDVGITMHARDNTDLYTRVTREVASVSGVKETTIALVPLLLKDIYHWQIPDSEIPAEIPARQPPFVHPQNSVKPVDRLDRELVDLLREDPRMPAAHIARRLQDITPRAVSDRIDALVQEGVICVTAIVHPEQAGFPVRADMHIKVESRQILEVAQRLARLEQTTWVACAIGESDLGVQFCARDNGELYKFVTGIVHRIPGITRTSTTLVSQILKDIYDWRMPDSVLKN